VGILGVFWDITERKQAEEARKQQWAQFLTIIDNFPEILYVTDPQTNEVVFVNDVFEQALGSDPVGKKCYEAFQGFEAPCDFCTNEIILEERKPYTWEYHNRLLDRYYRITDQIIKWPDGRDMRFEVAIDITERRRAEDQLRQHRDNLEELVQQRTAELRQQSETISRQAQEILEISTPVMQVWEGVVIAPLIGTLDSQRTQRFMEVLLQRIVETQSPIALVDITAVPTIDTQTAYHLLETISAVRLLGAQVVLTGVSPAIAQSLVHLGIDLSDIITRSSLAAGLRVALDRQEQSKVGRNKANL
jgi:anti-anti-sigma regulatory factor